MSAGSPPANGTGEPTMSTRYRTGCACLTSSITVAVVAALATPVAPGGATLPLPCGLHSAQTDGRYHRPWSRRDPRGKETSALRVAGLTHTEVAAPPAT